MKFNVTKIEFDFTQEFDEPDEHYQDQITRDNLGVWEADDEESLVDKISDYSGWLIKSIKYTQVSP